VQLSKSKYSQEKVLEKIQKAIRNRENFLAEQRNRLREHVRHNTNTTQLQWLYRHNC